MDVNDIIQQARRPEKTVELCLRGDLVAEHEELDRQRAKAEQEASNSLAGSPARAIAEQMKQMQDQMAESTIVFRLRGLPRRRYNDLYAAHPPHIDTEGKTLPVDAAYGYHTESFWPALIAACLIEPELDEGVLDGLLQDALSDRQFDDLTEAALYVNRGRVDIPFSRAASRLLQNSESE
jgi:hypothetical protein